MLYKLHSTPCCASSCEPAASRSMVSTIEEYAHIYLTRFVPTGAVTFLECGGYAMANVLHTADSYTALAHRTLASTAVELSRDIALTFLYTRAACSCTSSMIAAAARAAQQCLQYLSIISLRERISLSRPAPRALSTALHSDDLRRLVVCAHTH